MTLLRCFAVALLLVGSVTLSGATETEIPSRTAMNRHVAAASLEVLVEGRLSGSGWFVDSQGLAFTAAHVVRNLGRVEVISKKFGRLPAEILGFDLGHDLALLKVARYGEPYPYLSLATPPHGLHEPLYLFGSPLGRHGLMVPGTLASTQTRFEWNDRNHCYVEVLSLAAMTPEGFSGGPWINQAGEVVGLQSGMIIYREQLGGIAFAAPLKALNALLQNRRTIKTLSLGGTLTEAWEVAHRRPGAEKRTEGLYFLPRNGAAAAGNLERNDLIFELDGGRVRYRDDFLRSIRAHSAGEKIKLKVLRSSGEVVSIVRELKNLDDF